MEIRKLVKWHFLEEFLPFYDNFVVACFDFSFILLPNRLATGPLRDSCMQQQSTAGGHVAKGMRKRLLSEIVDNQRAGRAILQQYCQIVVLPDHQKSIKNATMSWKYHKFLNLKFF